jgi:hypothetical protein
MSDDKLKLPTTMPAKTSLVSDPVQMEILKTQRAGIDAGAKVEVARLQVAKEAITATKAFFDVLRSHNELEATRIEWEGRVSAAETSVRKAEVDLVTEREKNQPRLEELRQTKKAQDRLLALFDDVMKELTAADLGDDSKAKSRQYLLQLSDLIVKLKR